MKTTAFKNTDIGPIPEDWEVVPLGTIGEPLMCKRILKSQTLDCGDVPFYKISTFGKLADAYISVNLFEDFKRKYSYPNKGDILLSAAGTIGRKVVFDGHESYYQDSNIVWIDNDEGKVLNEYLFWWYEVIKWNTEDGGIVTRLYNDNLKSSLIAVPPLPEQRRIAAALSDADELVASLDKLIEKKKRVKEGAMQRLLSGETRLPGFTGKWVEKKLGECGPFRKGHGITREESHSGSIPAIRYGELYTTHHDIIREYPSRISETVAKQAVQLKKGDILFACSGETKEEIGKSAAFVDTCEAYAGGDLLILSPNADLDSAFLGYALNRSSCVSQKAAAGQGDAVVHIREEALKEVIVSLPPTLAEQRAIAAVLSDMDEEIAALARERAEAERIKQGMMQELLTGKTRLKGE